MHNAPRGEFGPHRFPAGPCFPGGGTTLHHYQSAPVGRLSHHAPQPAVHAIRAGNVGRKRSERTGSDIRIHSTVYFQAQRIGGLQLSEHIRPRGTAGVTGQGLHLCCLGERFRPRLFNALADHHSRPGRRIATKRDPPCTLPVTQHGSVNRTAPWTHS